MRKAAIGLGLLGVLVIAIPALAQTNETIEIFLDGVVRRPPDVHRVHTETVPENMIGWTCTGTATTANNASEHDGNNFLFTSGSSTASILDWEAVAGATTSMTGTLVLGPTITIDLELGSDVSSGGVSIVLSCSQPEPTTTTTTTTTTSTTTPPPTTPPTTPPTSPPTTSAGTTTTVAPPEGGVAAGGGATAVSGDEAAVLWLTGGALALLGGATVLATRRSSREQPD